MKFIVETISCSETENTEYFHQLGLQEVTLTWVTEERKNADGSTEYHQKPEFNIELNSLEELEEFDKKCRLSFIKNKGHDEYFGVVLSWKNGQGYLCVYDDYFYD